MRISISAKITSTALFFSAAAMMAIPATAQVTVIGNGLGKSCYEATQKATKLNAPGIETCSLALESLGLSRDDRTATLVNRAILYMRDGRLHDAEKDLNRARLIRPDLAEIDLNLGALRLYQGRDLEAVSFLTASIENGTIDLAAAYYNRGVANLRLENVQTSYEDFFTAAELKPDWDLPKQQLERFAPLDTDTAG